MQSYNFSAGPAVMPSEVLAQIQADLAQSQKGHMSILEISHRSLTFDKIVDQAKDRLRELMNLPQDYEVLFVQGGGSLQFEMVPLNFANQKHQIAVLDSGNFAHKAAQAAQAEGVSAKIVASSRDEKYRYLPQLPADFSAPAYDYLHITTNNTIEGTCYHQSNLPQTTGPLVADMSSNILAEPYDVRNFDLIFAGAQKNLGPAGVTVVIVKKSWLAQQNVTKVGPMMRYQSYLDKNSMYNTPPVFNIYALNLVLGWVQDQGGVPAMYAANQKKAQLLYDYLDQSDFYHPLVTGADRSLTNVVFSTGNDQLDQTIAQQAQEYGLYNLAGHRSVGGFRASLYNAQPLAAVTALIDYLDKAQKEHQNER
ncbi:3-phosphoserine/phosphohydroxythreonine transaminase [Convivina intestini]|uniref:Phosphoserine aminotransferase n=1 Tax=Convivina intestini TaxID=1505726 RepID=A0A2U1D932_9LACO|nr:3-phosphoserine/phosphohydroxythreonine transaminase [Convivina intestini]PVY84139.1 phosphoserine aminotransferase [Convivina intestini]CAH1854443.1 Phosphoserine aminotransferase [Convivina intestini]SDB91398.1 phosphoserine aminotransferase apoenzyme [Leuconostocaceae bacterium R-53105]